MYDISIPLEPSSTTRHFLTARGQEWYHKQGATPSQYSSGFHGWAVREAKKNREGLHRVFYFLGVTQVYKDKLRAIPRGERYAAAAKEIDRIMRAFSRDPDMPKISCKSGCSGCCYQKVAASLEEAEALAFTGLVDFDFALASTQRAWVTDDDWHRRPFKEARCMYLRDDGACGRYELRPLACRVYQVASDPKFCDRSTVEQTEQVVLPMAEAVVTAMYQLTESMGSLPAQVLKVLETPSPESGAESESQCP